MIVSTISSVQQTPTRSARVSENQRDMNGHSKGHLSKLPDDVFTNISEKYLSRKEMAHFSCVSKEIESDLNKIAQRVNYDLRNKLDQKITETEIVGIQISPGPFRNDIQKMSVLEMQNINLGTAITVLKANNITNINEMERGMTPLDRAIGNGDATVVAALITAGANVNVSNKLGWTPLLIAACTCNGNATVVAALIAAGANVNVSNKLGWTPLHWAAINGDATVVNNLIAAGANVNRADKNGWTPLHWAARNGDATVLEALVIAGADVNVTNNDGRTALQLAKRYDHELSFKNAIEEGKKKLISLHLSHVEKAVISPIHECESLREPLLQNEPENLTETQKKQAIKYIKEQSFRTKFKIFGDINPYNDIKKYFWK